MRDNVTQARDLVSQALDGDGKVVGWRDAPSSPVTGVSLAQALLFSCRLMIRSVSSTVPRYHQKIQSRKAGS